MATCEWAPSAAERKDIQEDFIAYGAWLVVKQNHSPMKLGTSATPPMKTQQSLEMINLHHIKGGRAGKSKVENFYNCVAVF